GPGFIPDGPKASEGGRYILRGFDRHHRVRRGTSGAHARQDRLRRFHGRGYRRALSYKIPFRRVDEREANARRREGDDRVAEPAQAGGYPSSLGLSRPEESGRRSFKTYEFLWIVATAGPRRRQISRQPPRRQADVQAPEQQRACPRAYLAGDG